MVEDNFIYVMGIIVSLIGIIIPIWWKKQTRIQELEIKLFEEHENFMVKNIFAYMYLLEKIKSRYFEVDSIEMNNKTMNFKKRDKQDDKINLDIEFRKIDKNNQEIITGNFPLTYLFYNPKNQEIVDKIKDARLLFYNELNGIQNSLKNNHIDLLDSQLTEGKKYLDDWVKLSHELFRLNKNQLNSKINYGLFFDSYQKFRCNIIPKIRNRQK